MLSRTCNLYRFEMNFLAVFVTNVMGTWSVANTKHPKPKQTFNLLISFLLSDSDNPQKSLILQIAILNGTEVILPWEIWTSPNFIKLSRRIHTLLFSLFLPTTKLFAFLCQPVKKLGEKRVEFQLFIVYLYTNSSFCECCWHHDDVGCGVAK